MLPVKVESAIQYVIGQPNKAMGFIYILLMVNMMISLFNKKKFLDLLKETLELAVVYMALIILGNIIDSLQISQLMGWTGSTQYLICLFLLAREIRKILSYIGKRYGIIIPILNERLDNMESGKTVSDADPSPPSASQVHEKLKELESEPSGPSASNDEPQHP